MTQGKQRVGEVKKSFGKQKPPSMQGIQNWEKRARLSSAALSAAQMVSWHQEVADPYVCLCGVSRQQRGSHCQMAVTAQTLHSRPALFVLGKNHFSSQREKYYNTELVDLMQKRAKSAQLVGLQIL